MRSPGFRQRAFSASGRFGAEGSCKIRFIRKDLNVRDKLAQDMTTDQVLNFNGIIPKEVTIEDKTTVEQMRLIQQLD